MKAVDSQTSRWLDQETIIQGTPSLVLMERAGKGAAEWIHYWIQTKWSKHIHQILILCGKGNNGGDGFVVARYLKTMGYRVIVLATHPLEELSRDAQINAYRLHSQVPLFFSVNQLSKWLQPSTLVVDGLLGTGTLKGALRSPVREWIDEVNDSKLPVVALDLPSGVNADDGSIGDRAIFADLTVTFGLPKVGLFLNHGLLHSGCVKVVPIGLKKELIDRVSALFEVITDQDLQSFILRLPRDYHKGKAGKVLVIGGSRNYPGAPILSCEAALRVGAGLVYLTLPQHLSPIQIPRSAAIIHYPIPDDENGYYHSEGVESLAPLLEQVHAIAIGPGLGRQPCILEFLRRIFPLPIPMVIDADALFFIPQLLDCFPRPAPTIITPHPGEMDRLLKGLGLPPFSSQQRIELSKSVAKKLESIVVMKGPASLVVTPHGEVWVNSTGGPELATGGTGDILTGMIAGLLPNTPFPLTATLLGVYLHGLAGELSTPPTRSLWADRLLEAIPSAISQVNIFA